MKASLKRSAAVTNALEGDDINRSIKKKKLASDHLTGDTLERGEEVPDNAVINVDILSKVSRFLDTGDELMALLVALGPVDSRTMRQYYLRNNDSYLVKCLRRCRLVMDPGFGLEYLRSIKYSIGRLEMYQHSVKHHVGRLERYLHSMKDFNKCRRNIQTWISANADWRSRCTPASMAKHRIPFQMDANVFFNNPVVAIELGLRDVFAYLVNEKGVDVCDRTCRGLFFTDHLLVVALYRGDLKILKTLLSSDTFRTSDGSSTYNENPSKVLSQRQILEFCYKEDWICIEVFRALLAHPKIDPNARRDDNVPCLLLFLQELDTFLGENRPHYNVYGTEYRVRRIMALLEAGADPCAAKGDNNDDESDEDPDDGIWYFTKPTSVSMSPVEFVDTFMQYREWAIQYYEEETNEKLSAWDKAILAIWEQIMDKM